VARTARAVQLRSQENGHQEDGPVICAGAPGSRVPLGICLIDSRSAR
jgi:hypothetical protein